jgi:hypothetical protein
MPARDKLDTPLAVIPGPEVSHVGTDVTEPVSCI